mmetsp:Transcript_17340/g.47825  ORF Transcript_17340/g.47825 Transcript_17340/m.47825 type:complete len:617 (-) Transcript_17340:517-2367(-)
MIFPKSIFFVIAVAMAVVDQSPAHVAGFVLPDCTRAKFDGGKKDTTASDFSTGSSQGSVFQRLSQKNLDQHQSQSKSPRMSEAEFRLEYIQGVRPSFNNKAPVIEPVEDETETLPDDREFVYGRDSTCYRGMTKPTKAGLVLALVLASGMVAASPEIHLSVSSLPLLLEGTRHLLGEETASAFGVLADRMAFDWVMSGLPHSFHHLSDQVAASLDTKLVPFVAHQKEHLQQALTALPSRLDGLSALPREFDGISVRIASQTEHLQGSLASLPSRLDGLSVRIVSQADAMKEDAMANMASARMTMDQAVASGRSVMAQQTTEWQLASHAQLDRWQNDIVQATADIQGGISQGWNKGKELLSEQSSSAGYAGQAKLGQLQNDLIRDSSRLQEHAAEFLARGKDAFLWKASEFQATTGTNVNRIQQDAVQTNERLQAFASHYSIETKTRLQQVYDAFQEASAATVVDVQQGLRTEAAKLHDTMENVQRLSQSTVNDVGNDFARWTRNVRNLLANTGADLETKRNNVGSSIGPMVQDSTQFLREKMLAIRDTSFVEWNKLQDGLAFHGDATMDAIGDNLQGWKASTADHLSSLQGSIGPLKDPMTTESTVLKSLLEEIVD